MAWDFPRTTRRQTPISADGTDRPRVSWLWGWLARPRVQFCVTVYRRCPDKRLAPRPLFGKAGNIFQPRQPHDFTELSIAARRCRTAEHANLPKLSLSSSSSSSSSSTHLFARKHNIPLPKHYLTKETDLSQVSNSEQSLLLLPFIDLRSRLFTRRTTPIPSRADRDKNNKAKGESYFGFFHQGCRILRHLPYLPAIRPLEFSDLKDCNPVQHQTAGRPSLPCRTYGSPSARRG